jgi:hypothetical protein
MNSPGWLLPTKPVANNSSSKPALKKKEMAVFLDFACFSSITKC